MLNIGVSIPADLGRNIETLRGGLTFSNADRRLLADFARRCYDHESVERMRTV
jgi:hypothetical protein